MTALSVVIISKNQEWNIARLIESLLAETDLSSREIVLVDSASIDKTVEIARNYPIDIIRLHPEQRLTAAVGRYVGYHHTTGERILFLDGDMELRSGWLTQAMAIMDNQEDVAVVTGQSIDISSPDERTIRLAEAPTSCAGTATEVLHGGGAALYRRSVLEQVGTFHPYIYSDEEPELCVRIRYAGYRILRLEYPMVFHFSSPRNNVSTLVARRRRNLWVGSGQNMRYHLHTGLLWPYMKERGHGIIPGIGITAGLVSLLWSVITRRWGWFGLWLWLVAGVLAGDAYRKRNLYLTFSSLVKRIFIFEGMVRGFLMKPMHPEDYPIQFDLVSVPTQRRVYE